VKGKVNVLVIGAGGREHAMAWKLSKSRRIGKLWVAPGNAGMAELAELVDIPAKDQDALLKFCKASAVDLVVVGPEAPLVDGLVDRFEKEGLRVFGPSREAARLEGSKVFSKELMKKLSIPTGEFEVFDQADRAMDYVAKKGVPIVIKVDGLAGGKGVVVAASMPKAMEAIHLDMVKKVFGKAGERVVVEECLDGEEASVIGICDGKTVRLFASSQDHKRIFDGDKGPNTGGMGAYSPAPVVTPELEREILERVFMPVVDEFRRIGHPYRGFLYAGIMLTSKGFRVLEFNVRLGDPETQVILPRLKNDFLDLLDAAIDGRLSEVSLEWEDEDCVCVVIAAGGYPDAYESGARIAGIENARAIEGIQVFHAGTKRGSDGFVTAGGRVLNVVGSGRSLFEALSRTYSAVERIFFDKMHYRTDIGHRATKTLKH
jgi:phosphoribosylamine---glycine ligase